MLVKRILVLLLCLGSYMLLRHSRLHRNSSGYLDEFGSQTGRHWTQKGFAVHLEEHPVNDRDDAAAMRDLFPHNTSSKLNPYFANLPICPYKVNQNTQHIRLPHARLSQIHMATPDIPQDDNKYFNPTILTLPAWSKYDYVVFARLVTPGLHQETHFCPAKVNATTHDLHCSLSPRRLDIAPTAAYRCTGRWASFPDIPGFHDPRVFWSGKGEPLIIVNSASAASPNGCVGLWVVDLRVIIDELSEWITRRPRRDDSTKDVDTKNKKERADGLEIMVQPKMSYSHLTELTKNPRSSRKPVEKNWVLFFPRGEESWVMYDMVAYKRAEQRSGHIMSAGDQHFPLQTQDNVSVEEQHTIQNLTWQSTRQQNMTFNASTYLQHAGSQRTGTNDKNASVNRTNLLVQRDLTFISQQNQIILTPARSMAKLLGAGLASTNLTSPHEVPCFNESHNLDTLGSIGYWHQGSNSLRLVLCQRLGQVKSATYLFEQCSLTSENESDLVKQGKVVHFMVMHRKFSNEFDLPMRYERYFLLWEARWPFHVLGLSHHPILLAGERAQPWSEEENWPSGGVENITENALRREQQNWNDTYFSYSPSLAWASRPSGLEESHADLRMLGTGYLGDEIFIGIGMNDEYQGFTRVKVDELLSCMRLCPQFEHSN